MVSADIIMVTPSDERHGTLLPSGNMSLHDTMLKNLSHHMVSLCHNEFAHLPLGNVAIILNV